MLSWVLVSSRGSASGLGGVDVGEGDVGGMQLCWGRGGSLSVEDQDTTKLTHSSRVSGSLVTARVSGAGPRGVALEHRSPRSVLGVWVGLVMFCSVTREIFCCFFFWVKYNVNI